MNIFLINRFSADDLFILSAEYNDRETHLDVLLGQSNSTTKHGRTITIGEILYANIAGTGYRFYYVSNIKKINDRCTMELEILGESHLFAIILNTLFFFCSFSSPLLFYTNIDCVGYLGMLFMPILWSLFTILIMIHNIYSELIRRMIRGFICYFVWHGFFYLFIPICTILYVLYDCPTCDYRTTLTIDHSKFGSIGWLVLLLSFFSFIYLVISIKIYSKTSRTKN